MKEDSIPFVERGRPDPRHYTESVAYYQRMYDEFLASSARTLTRRETNLAWRQRVHATYGLLARGIESMPYALQLLRHEHEDAREDAATILADIGAAPAAAKALREALRTETDDVARTAIAEALGQKADST